MDEYGIVHILTSTDIQNELYEFYYNKMNLEFVWCG